MLPENSPALERYPNFPSKFCEPRQIDVWLPPEYSHAPEQRYPVLFMHDGQNLFDEVIAFTGIDWGVDEALVRLIDAGKIRAPIVVGVWNISTRWLDYIPQKPCETPAGRVYKNEALQNYGLDPESELSTDNYLRFVVQELKPFIDKSYRTLTGRTDTFVMGSSMGGLASLYALSEYPEIFGGAGCLSTHWPAGKDVFLEWFKTHLPKAGAHKIYFDYGTATLDSLYEPYQLQMDHSMRQLGYSQGVDWITMKFSGAEHNEAAWRARVHIPLEFLLKV
jgi:predicted alpha/beta superfamily hydrolase